jgi:hypothetical protein
VANCRCQFACAAVVDQLIPTDCPVAAYLVPGAGWWISVCAIEVVVAKFATFAATALHVLAFDH